MSVRVLSTETAKQSITRMQQIINSGLIEQIEALHREGTTLSQPDIWDGQLAMRFRDTWTETNTMLRNTHQRLEELRASIQQINANIMQAGGNS